MKTYSEKLKDPRWQKKRLEIMQRDDFSCCDCGETTRTLNVDHKVYRPNYQPWDYPDDDLWTLCEDCHEYLTAARKKIADQIGRMNRSEITNLEKSLSGTVAKQVMASHHLRAKACHIYFLAEKTSGRDLVELRNILLDYPGSHVVYLHSILRSSKEEFVLELPTGCNTDFQLARPAIEYWVQTHAPFTGEEIAQLLKQITSLSKSNLL